MLAALARLAKLDAASGVLLLLAGGIAFACANSSVGHAYHAFWQLEVGGTPGGLPLRRSLEWLVNDGLMAVFFFQVGLEIRLEQSHGQLSEWRRAALPMAAALGGMLVPAACYLMLAGEPSTRSGWGVPMATDIAFALGVLALLGKRVPPSLRVLLLAVAVIDDLGAILVIAFFYSQGVSLSGFLVAGAALGLIALMRRWGVQHKLAYVLPALVAWGGTYAAGVHPTIAGVAVGLLTPVVPLAGRQKSPAEELVHVLHPWVNFAIMPIFALANAAVEVRSGDVAGEARSVLLGAALGLLLGKPVGVLLASALALRLRLATLPTGITRRHVLLLGLLAGIGFTMALFIAKLAFQDSQLLDAAKLGVLAASVSAGLLALLVGRLLLPAPAAPALKAEH